MKDKPDLTFQVRGEEPREAIPALFSNFLAVSRVGTEVQFEFVYLDLNVIANLIKAATEAATGSKASLPEVTGKTVAKIVMPAASFVQIKEHLLKLLEDAEAEIRKAREAQNEYNRAR